MHNYFRHNTQLENKATRLFQAAERLYALYRITGGIELKRLAEQKLTFAQFYKEKATQ